jgi:acetyltransferase-like isoleucine patch superfamily enzyme
MKGKVDWLKPRVERLLDSAPSLARLVLLVCRYRDDYPRIEGLARAAVVRRRLKFCGPHVSVGRNVTLRGTQTISFERGVVINDHVYIASLREVSIGYDSHVDVMTSIYGHGGVKIGNQCAIAAGVRIYSQSNDYKKGMHVPIVEQPRIYDQVVIGNDVWIGAKHATRASKPASRSAWSSSTRSRSAPPATTTR